MGVRRCKFSSQPCHRLPGWPWVSLLMHMFKRPLGHIFILKFDFQRSSISSDFHDVDYARNFKQLHWAHLKIGLFIFFCLSFPSVTVLVRYFPYLSWLFRLSLCNARNCPFMNVYSVVYNLVWSRLWFLGTTVMIVTPVIWFRKQRKLQLAESLIIVVFLGSGWSSILISLVRLEECHWENIKSCI